MDEWSLLRQHYKKYDSSDHYDKPKRKPCGHIVESDESDISYDHHDYDHHDYDHKNDDKSHDKSHHRDKCRGPRGPCGPRGPRGPRGSPADLDPCKLCHLLGKPEVTLNCISNVDIQLDVCRRAEGNYLCYDSDSKKWINDNTPKNTLGSGSLVVSPVGTSEALPGGSNPPKDGDEWVDPATGDRYIFQHKVWNYILSSPLGSDSDVTLTNPSDGDYLCYDECTHEWVNDRTPRNILGTTQATGPVAGTVGPLPGTTNPPKDGDEWVDPVTGNRYFYQNGVWVSVLCPPLGCISNVCIEGLTDGQYLHYDANSECWINVDPPRPCECRPCISQPPLFFGYRRPTTQNITDGDTYMPWSYVVRAENNPALQPSPLSFNTITSGCTGTLSHAVRIFIYREGFPSAAVNQGVATFRIRVSTDSNSPYDITVNYADNPEFGTLNGGISFIAPDNIRLVPCSEITVQIISMSDNLDNDENYYPVVTVLYCCE